MNFKDFFRAKPIKAYWWRGVSNFGDMLAPLLLERFAEVRVEWGTVSHSSIVSIGSLLEHLPPLWDGYIVGSGKLFENTRIHNMRDATILAVRGPLSARGLKGSFALGDPGLLANELVGAQEKQWSIGLLPHWEDKELVPKFQALIPSRYPVKVINPQDDPLTVLRQIGACGKIVTSSLHGVIVADAFRVPRRIEVSSLMRKDGGDFKFRDYCASIHMNFETGKVATPHRGRVEDVQSAIFDAYRELGVRLKK
jgi:pyruvyltransferase